MEQSNKVAEKQAMVATNMRFRADLWKRAMHVRADGRAKSLRQICNEGLELRLNQLEAQQFVGDGEFAHAK